MKRSALSIFLVSYMLSLLLKRRRPSVTLQRQSFTSFSRQKRSSICSTFASSWLSMSTIGVFDASRPFSCSRSFATASAAGRCRQRLVDIPQDVVERLEADRHAHHVRRDAGLDEIGFFHLAMGGRSGMDDERLRVADVGEVAHELRGLDEALAGPGAALDAEVEQSRGALREVLL